METRIIVFGSPACPDVPWVRRLLDRSEVEFDYVDIARSIRATEQVMTINGGNASVPTLLFPDGSTLTEPSEAELVAKLTTLGYRVPEATALQRLVGLLEHPSLRVLAVIGFAIGYSERLYPLIYLTLVLIVLSFVLPKVRL